MNKIKKLIFLSLFMPIFGYSSLQGYKETDKFLSQKSDYYVYEVATPIKSEVNTSIKTPAQSVPILLYHGVNDKYDSENTYQDKFIEQMEMLKRNGYQTISIREYEDFKNGRGVLPSKPIIITFDDGRRDSYYPVDDVFKKLGFKATLFVATAGAENNDSFYLNWDELKEAISSGRWEIEAHGRNSHDKIIIDKTGKEGYFLSSRRYTEAGLESVEEYKKRVEQDYINGINDLKENLGIEPKYYAKPLEDYGVHPVNNYDDAHSFNEELVKKYFALAFIQANDSVDLDNFLASPYNFKHSDPYSLRRIQVKNMDATTLKHYLDTKAPEEPTLFLSQAGISKFRANLGNLYGEVYFMIDGLHLNSSETHKSARVTFGQDYWTNYVLEAEMKKISGRSVVVVGRLHGDNYIAVGITDNSLFLREGENGQEIDLAYPVRITNNINTDNKFKLEFEDETVSVFFNDKLIFNKIDIKSDRGAVAFKVWDPIEKAESVLYNISVYPIDYESFE